MYPGDPSCPGLRRPLGGALYHQRAREFQREGARFSVIAAAKHPLLRKLECFGGQALQKTGGQALQKTGGQARKKLRLEPDATVYFQ